MEATLKAVYIALQIAPLIALLLIMPHTVLGYAREKSVNVRRSTYVYIFILYFICAYFMTMLPLPSEDFFLDPPPLSEQVQLVPFNCFFETNLLRSPIALAIIVFNVFLTVPLGFFLRFLFGFRFSKTLLAGFLTSVLYEITQLTGLFFIYPSPYRIFDVDDLIINTLGAVIGYFTVPILSRILPPPSDSKRNLVQGSEVSFPQRCVATLIDLAFVFCAVAVVIFCVPPLRNFFVYGGSLLRFPLYYLLFLFFGVAYALMFEGGTLGAKLTGLRLLTKGGKRASRFRGALRSTLICSSVIAIPFWVYFFMTVNTEYAGARSIVWVFLGALLMMCAAAVLLEMLFNAVTHGSSMFYDRFSKTYIAYGSSRKTSLFGIRVLDIQPLTDQNVDVFSEEICDTLRTAGFPHESVTKVRLMAEGVMLDWIENGLANTPCELRLDKRYRRNALMLSVSGEDKTNEAVTEGYTDMLRGLDLTLETYYAGEKNICNILIPEKNNFFEKK